MLMGRDVKLVFDLRPKALLSSSGCQADGVYSRNKTIPGITQPDR